MSALTNKELVLGWFSAGPGGANEMLADDFVWHTPRGPAELLSGGDTDFGRDAFEQLAAIEKAAYNGGAAYDMTFCIAEDEWVAMQLNVRSTSHDGDVYANVYVMTIRCQDGKIAELWEHADTKLWWDTIVGRPDQAEAFKKRLSDERAAIGV